MGEGGWRWGGRGDGGGAGSGKRGRGQGVCACVSVSCGSGEAPFHSPKARAGPRGLQRPLLLSMGEAQPGQCDLPGPDWRETRRVGLGSLGLYSFLVYFLEAPEGP